MKAQLTSSKWTYRRVSHPIGLEASDWSGAHSPSLSTHFHDEPQISVVLSGCRVFEIGRHTVRVDAGSFALIPAGTPHRSVRVGALETVSKDIFLDVDQLASDCSSAIMLGSVAGFAIHDVDRIEDELLESLGHSEFDGIATRMHSVIPQEISYAVRSSNHSIAELARQTGYSREGFIRKFNREIGMTPHAYRVAHRASQARRLLRTNTPPAVAAYACGFADQSHLGRVFRKNFGTTPAAFRKVWSL